MRYDHFSMLPEKAFQPRGGGPFGGGMTLEGGGISSAISSVGNVISDIGNTVVSAVENPVVDAIAGAGLAAFTGGASLALDVGTVASADATAAGLGFSSAAEAIQAGATTAEALGLPAATTAADLASVAGSASSGWAGLGQAAGVAGGVSSAASQFTPEMIAAANSSSDPVGMLSYLSGASPQEIQAATGAGAQASPLSQLLGYAQTGSQITGGLGGLAKIAGGVAGLTGQKTTPQQAAPFSQYQPALASQLYNLLQNPSTVTTTPGYQFNLSQGLNALQAQQASQGRLVSGGALEQANQFGQQYAQSSLTNQEQMLASLTGATQSPAQGASTASNIGLTNTATTLGAANAIASGLGQVSNPLATLYANYNS